MSFNVVQCWLIGVQLPGTSNPTLGGAIFRISDGPVHFVFREDWPEIRGELDRAVIEGYSGMLDSMLRNDGEKAFLDCFENQMSNTVRIIGEFQFFATEAATVLIRRFKALMLSSASAGAG